MSARTRGCLAALITTPVIAIGWTGPAAHAAGTAPGSGPHATVTSTSASGYALLTTKGKRLRYVQAQAGLPNADCQGQPDAGGEVVESVGLGGYPANTRRDARVQAAIELSCAPNGDLTPAVAGWYQLGSAVRRSFGIRVAVTDLVRLSVYFTGRSFRLRLDDLSTHRSATRYARCPAGDSCTRKSAEVVIQVPDVAAGYVVYPCTSYSFQHVQVTSSRGKHGTAAAQRGYWTSTKIMMQDQYGRIIVKPGPASRSRKSFEVSCDPSQWP